MDKINPRVTATATAHGGRNGHTESSDGVVKADLSVPKAMGGPGKPGTATPEHLFAAGYAACFGGALDFVGKQHKKDASKASITCAVTIGKRAEGGFGLAVKMHVADASLPQAELDRLLWVRCRAAAEGATPGLVSVAEPADRDLVVALDGVDQALLDRRKMAAIAG